LIEQAVARGAPPEAIAAARAELDQLQAMLAEARAY
jgi:hypothetical protein